MGLKMLSDYVLVRADEAATETKTGIVMVQKNVEVPCAGTVVAFGPGKYDKKGTFVKSDLVVGGRIVYGKSSLNQPLEYSGEKFFVMRYEDIFAQDV